VDVSTQTVPQTKQRTVALAEIRVEQGFNPRERFERKQLDELAKSIAVHGLLQPIVVAEDGDGYRLIAGERRYRAAELAGLEQLPVVVRQPDEGSSGFELAIVENVAREQLDPLEEAKAYRRVMDEHGLTRKGVAERVGVAQRRVTDRLQILELPDELQLKLAAGELPPAAVKPLVGLAKLHPQLPAVAVGEVEREVDADGWEAPVTWRDLAADPIAVVAAPVARRAALGRLPVLGPLPGRALLAHGQGPQGPGEAGQAGPADLAAAIRPRGAAAGGGVIGVVVLFLVLVVVVWKSGVFDKDTSASDGQEVVAMLTLLGGLIASALTLVGVLLRNSIDRHTAHLAVETENRRNLEAQEIEHRLRLETSIKAVELLTMPDGKPAPRARQAGALFVLGSDPLEQLDLALALLNEHWRDGVISSSAAVWVIDKALTKTDPGLQEEAAETLQAHAERLPHHDGTAFAWPRCAELKWPTPGACPYLARDQLLFACTKGLASRRPEEWDESIINWFIAQFNRIRQEENSPDLNSAAVLVLDVLVDWSLRKHRGERRLHLPEGKLDLRVLRAELAPRIERALSEVSDGMSHLIEGMRADWSDAQSNAEVSGRPVQLNAPPPEPSPST
jgi:ParB/RepB/Spo0J family partition protein